MDNALRSLLDNKQALLFVVQLLAVPLSCIAVPPTYTQQQQQLSYEAVEEGERAIQFITHAIAKRALLSVVETQLRSGIIDAATALTIIAPDLPLPNTILQLPTTPITTEITSTITSTEAPYDLPVAGSSVGSDYFSLSVEYLQLTR